MRSAGCGASAPRGTGGVVEGGEAPHLFGAGLGAAHLEVVGDAVCEAVQHGIARQAEDVVDAVLLAPRHGLGPAVVAVSPEGEPGARPVPADAAHQVLEEGACTTSRAIGRWRKLQGKGAGEPVAVREFRISKRQPRPMPTDR